MEKKNDVDVKIVSWTKTGQCNHAAGEKCKWVADGQAPHCVAAENPLSVRRRHLQ